MLIVGERINSSRKSIENALNKNDIKFLLNEAKIQIEAGVNFLDINTATMLEKEPDYLVWLIEEIQSTYNIPICIDSPNCLALKAAFKANKGQAMLNSLTGEEDRINKILPLILEYNPIIVILCIDDNGIPCDINGRLKIISKILATLSNNGVSLDNLYVDPLVKPLCTETEAGIKFLESVKAIKSEFGVKTIAALSNISYGLPSRKLINQAFAIMTLLAGIDALIIDPLDRKLCSLLKASEVLVGRDEFAYDYICAFKEGKLL